MKLFRRSLARRMATIFLLSYAAMLLALIMLVRPLIVLEGDDQLGGEVATFLAIDTVVRGTDGAPAFRPTPKLKAFRAAAPRLWIIAQLDGRRLEYGAVPARVRSAVDRLPPTLEAAAMTVPGVARPQSSVTIQMVDTPAGSARFAVGGVAASSVGWGAWFDYVIRTQLVLLIPVMAVLGLGAIAITVPLVLRILRPLAREAEAVGPEHLDRRITEVGVVAELRPIVVGFNRALDRLADAFGRQRQFVADVAHELRTPIAVLGAQVDLLSDAPSKRELQRGITRLGGLVGQMLDSERLVLADRQREPTDLVMLARTAVGDIAPLAIAAGYKLAVEADVPSVVATIDAQAFGRAIGNLLGNAVAHGGRAGTIVLRVRSNGSIEVEDEGPGIPPEARERVFEPFRRERWDRDGCGLGLYLVRQIISAHGGTIDLSDGAAGGALFRIDLPVSAVGSPSDEPVNALARGNDNR